MIILDACAFVKGLLEGKMIKQEFLRLARQYPVAAAMKSNEDMQVALESDALLLFLLKGDAFQLAPFVLEAHQRGKGVVVHVDLVSGIGKDRAGIQYLHQIGIDAIITSRSQLVSAGRAEGLTTIQRLLLVDDSALDTGVRTIARAAPDIVEILPGIIFPEIAPTLQRLLPGPFIAGGFIRSTAEVARVQAAGCILSSSSTYTLWHRTPKE
jgi:glycerol uptake operon antiterminator